MGAGAQHCDYSWQQQSSKNLKHQIERKKSKPDRVCSFLVPYSSKTCANKLQEQIF
jgi:hypothetical protein